MASRTPLSRDRIINAAATVADGAGLAAVSMRSVARVLGVEAMSLYHHVPNKEALLDDLADWVFARIELPAVGDSWREAITARARSARSVLTTHPWALGMMESRPNPGPALLQHHDRLLGVLMTEGFSAALATHAFSAIDAYVYGFALTETSLPFEPGDGAEEAFADKVAASAELYPHIARSRAELFGGGGYSFADEFDYGLELLLEGLERRVADANSALRERMSTRPTVG
jgi:AcrR family transcriptional regulator